MSSERFLNNKIELRCGDCLGVLPTLAENSIDACVCDPRRYSPSHGPMRGWARRAPARINQGQVERQAGRSWAVIWGRTSVKQGTKTRKPFEYESVPRREVRTRIEQGWVILSDHVRMAPPEYLDEELLAVAEAARAVA